MSIQLTTQQQQALDTQENGPPRIIDPRTNTTYISLFQRGTMKWSGNF